MKRSCLALLALAAFTASCNGRTAQADTPQVTLKGQKIEIKLLAADKDRRPAPASLGAAAEGRGYLLAWPRERYLKIESNRVAAYDVAFLSLSGKVVDHRTLPAGDEEGIMSGAEAAYALLAAPGLLKKLDVKIGDSADLSAEIKGAKPEELPVLKIGDVTAYVELALNVAERSHGLMFRPRMSADDGMLFAYATEGRREFWMKNTLIPLDIAFFTSDGTLLNVNETPTAADPRQEPYPRSPSAGPARFVLEMNRGWFKKKGIVDESGKVKPGTKAILPDEARKGED